MEIILGFLFVLLAAFGVWLLLRDQRRAHETEALRRSLYAVEAEVGQLKAELYRIQLPPATASDRDIAIPAEEAPPADATPPAEPGALADPGRPSYSSGRTVELDSPALERDGDPGSLPRRSPIPPTLTPPPEASLNWEQFVGAKLFAWLGGLALFFAAAFGLKYSFEHNLIPPALRATIGYAFGLGLVAAGWILKRREYSVTAQTLVATGVVILYAVAFSCRSLLQLPAFTPAVTFFVMAIVTAGAFTLAVRLNAQVVAVLGMLGGFLTPVLVSTGEDRPGALFSYITLLDFGLLAVAWHRRWDYLSLLAALGTLAMVAGWMAKFFVTEKLLVAQTILIGFPALFAAAFGWASRRGWVNHFLTAAAACLAAASLLHCFWLVVQPSPPLRPGAVFIIAFAADLCLLAMLAWSPKLRFLEGLGGGLMFLLLGTWLTLRLSDPLVSWALGFTMAFAGLHTAVPILLRRWRGQGASTEPPPLWSQCFPALGLVLALIPLVRSLPSGPLFWMVILVVDALAIWVALTTGAAVGLALVICLTFVLAGARMFLGFGAADSFHETLIVTGGFSLALTVAAVWVGWSRPNLGGTAADRQQRWAAALPALSSLLPFLLLILIIGQFRPANPAAVYAVAAGLSLMLLGLVWLGGLGALSVMGVAAVGMVQASWQTIRLGSANPIAPLLWALGFCALYAGFPFLFRRRLAVERGPWIAGALSLATQGALVLWQVHDSFRTFPPGLIPGLFALPALAGVIFLAWRLPAESPARLTILAWWGGVALLGITLIFPIQFDRQWITLGWAFEGAALCWLFHRIPHPGLRLVGVGLLTAAFIRLALNPAILGYSGRADGSLLNWMLYTYGLTATAHFVAARLLRPPRDQVWGGSAPRVLKAMGTLLAFLLVNLEIANYFNAGGRLRFEFSGNFARDMTYTIAWAVFALALVAIGVACRERAARYSGLVLLGVTLAKLFLHDLSRLNQIYRIAAFAAVAVVALLASFLYQRLASRRPEDESPPDVSSGS